MKYRPFVVSEEKILLIALQQNSDEAVIRAIKEMITACTFNQTDIEKLPSVDLEYLFLMIRNKSMGEGLDLEMTCTSCDKKTVVSCNLDNITVKKSSHTDNNVKLTNELTITMRYPTLEMAYGLSDNDIDKTIEVMAKCIEFIEYQGKLYDTAELPFKEVIEFVENLTQQSLKKIDAWLSDLPQVVFDDSYVCAHCNAKNIIHIEGLNDFFA
jgi:transcription elongation factor Elf1